ncbi:hypothetical protein PEPS_18060 [Persicobacter psychrovividus]|uniref:Mannosyl-glycoprotein endo-beta-N-acetylglucosamidase-like domain-containing protein n=2 Tax=Persicobacter psychrovividus TaxID=387638 RepID=A0ABN6L941_9BACT|nr:hypothetical protein PEPS_18060 [Persicobacter psychrovividus]
MLSPLSNTCGFNSSTWGSGKMPEKNMEAGADANFIMVDDFTDIVKVDGPEVTPNIYQNLMSLHELPVKEKTSTFINMMLPAVLVARERKLAELKQVEALIASMDEKPSAASLLSPYMEKYKAKTIEELPERLTPPPVSMILAQSIMETGWGTSPIFTEANNAFGVWSFSHKEARRLTQGTRNGKKVYVRAYDNILESAENYLDIIGRVSSYKNLRKTMQKTDNSLILVNHLSNYSEEGSLYVKQLRSLIRKYELQRFDHYFTLPTYAV